MHFDTQRHKNCSCERFYGVNASEKKKYSFCCDLSHEVRIYEVPTP